MPWKISSKLQILFLSSIGVYRTVREFYSQNLEDVWQLKLSDSLSPYQNLITSVISGIILVREFTGHIYIASYFLILYPVIMGKLRSVLLLWMLVSGLRSVLLNLGVAIVGVILCSSRDGFNFACFKFVAEEALELGCSTYMWTIVNDYYHSLKKMSLRSHYQSPLNSPNASEIVDETSSSFVSDEWSLPSSLVEEFQRSTKENLIESATETTSDSVKNLKSKSVESLLAQAMVEWFLKKVFKIKPKGELEALEPTKLSNMTSNDVAALRKRIKKSISDIDESDIKELLISDNSRGRKERKTEKVILALKNEGTEEKVERIITHDSLNMSFFNNISRDFTSKTSNYSDSEYSDRLSDLFSDLSMTKLGITSCYNVNHSGYNAFDNKAIGCDRVNKLGLEPSNAVSFVKQIFEDVVENAVEISKGVSRVKNDISLKEINATKSTINSLLNDGVFNYEIRPLAKRANNDSTNDENCSNSNGKTMDSGTDIVKSLLNDIIDNVSDNKHGILKRETKLCEKPYQRSSSNHRCEACKILKTPLNDSSAPVKTMEKISFLKRISFLNKRLPNSLNVNDAKLPYFKLNFDSKARQDFDDFPERVRSVLKSINIERFSRKNDRPRKARKPYNKENENSKFTNNKSAKVANETETSVNALRYHFRRINQTKLPIKRSKETILSQKSLKSIIDGIKLREGKKVNLNEGAGSSNVLFTQQAAPVRRDLKLKDTSAQTITTKQLMSKIKEAEELHRSSCD